MTLLVNIDVPDLARAADFYVRGLGFTTARRFGPHAIELECGATRVYLLAKAAGSAAVPSSALRRDFDRHWTPVHFDVVVDDIEAALARARSAGASVETAIDSHAWGRIAGCADPFGNGFCLLQFSAAGYDAIAT